MSDSTSDRKLLTDATVQEIQLELIRRTSFNSMDGPRVVAHLQQHRDLWSAVMLDRSTYVVSGGLPDMGLIKLRDLPGNFWNADTLFILCATAENARRLAAFIEEEGWGEAIRVHENQEVTLRPWHKRRRLRCHGLVGLTPASFSRCSKYLIDAGFGSRTKPLRQCQAIDSPLPSMKALVRLW